MWLGIYRSVLGINLIKGANSINHLNPVAVKKLWKQIQGKNLSQLDNWASLTLQAFQNYWNLYVIYSSLPNRLDVTAINFWEFSTHNSVISATTFIKNGPNFAPPRLFQAPRLLKSRNQVVQLPTTPLFQPPHHSKLENVFGFHIKVWK